MTDHAYIHSTDCNLSLQDFHIKYPSSPPEFPIFHIFSFNNLYLQPYHSPHFCKIHSCRKIIHIAHNFSQHQTKKLICLIELVRIVGSARKSWSTAHSFVFIQLFTLLLVITGNTVIVYFVLLILFLTFVSSFDQSSHKESWNHPFPTKRDWFSIRLTVSVVR